MCSQSPSEMSQNSCGKLFPLCIHSQKRNFVCFLFRKTTKLFRLDVLSWKCFPEKLKLVKKDKGKKSRSIKQNDQKKKSIRKNAQAVLLNKSNFLEKTKPFTKPTKKSILTIRRLAIFSFLDVSFFFAWRKRTQLRWREKIQKSFFSLKKLKTQKKNSWSLKSVEVSKRTISMLLQ